QRFVPTGSTVAYVQEFKRGNEWVYALWTPRGERELNVIFGDDESRSLIDLYGRESSIKGKDSLITASPSVQYLVSKTKATAASVGKSTFIDDAKSAPKKPLQTILLDS